MVRYKFVIAYLKVIIIKKMKRLQTEEEDIPPPKADFSAPPPYEVATKLPSYEEVQREKTLQGEPYPQIHMVIIVLINNNIKN